MYRENTCQQLPAFDRTEALQRPLPIVEKYRSMKEIMTIIPSRSSNMCPKNSSQQLPAFERTEALQRPLPTVEKYRLMKEIMKIIPSRSSTMCPKNSSQQLPASERTETLQRPLPTVEKYRSMKKVMKVVVELSPPAKRYRSINAIMKNGEFELEFPPTRKYRSITDIMERAKHVSVPRFDYSQVICEACGSGEQDEELLLCDGCDKGFHMTCTRPVVTRIPLGPWFCFGCSDHQPLSPKEFSPSKVMSFFGIKAPMKCITPQVPRRRRRHKPWVLHKTRRLRPYIPTEDCQRRMEQMVSLRTALTSLGLKYSDELTYPTCMAPRSANQAEFEFGGMQVLSKEDRETMDLCIKMGREGKWPPLMVVFDSREGYTVEVDGPIKAMTFITEYTGDVDYIKNRENDDCDSMMTLLLATKPSDSLVICPDKHGNIARFINGINNHTQSKKPNLKCVRYSVDGKIRVFLVAVRDIAKGERLYYDYNGYENAYPTDHFV